MSSLPSFFYGSKNFEEYAQKYSMYLGSLLQGLDHAQMSIVVDHILRARSEGHTIYIVGNGGSASTASHYACDLSKNTFIDGEEPLRVVSLTDNVAMMTALGNDDGYDRVFVNQLRHLLRKDDIVIGISASGNSPNVIETFKFAHKVGAKTIAFVGFDGGMMMHLADHVVHIPTKKGDYGPVEDVHLIMNHMISTYLYHYLLDGREKATLAERSSFAEK